MNNETIARRAASLRRLIARPGTPTEGRAAQAALDRMEKKYGHAGPREEPSSLVSYVVGREWDEMVYHSTHHACSCGNVWLRRPGNHRCQNLAEHDRIRAEVHARFQRGARVRYNAWCYDNSPAVVVGYPSGKGQYGHSDWGWIRLRFDDLKNVRFVPAYKDGVWLLTLDQQ